MDQPTPTPTPAPELAPAPAPTPAPQSEPRRASLSEAIDALILALPITDERNISEISILAAQGRVRIIGTDRSILTVSSERAFARFTVDENGYLRSGEPPVLPTDPLLVELATEDGTGATRGGDLL